ncbi:MAG TPA: alpha/beta hydrolase-fold protein [Mycobacterium sp.]|nr:alpha/beta hydrolase-fold protein [Mycobacterium sp.]
MLVAVQALAGGALIAAMRCRSRRWRVRWIPLMAAFGVLTAIAAHWYLRTSGMASEPAPWQLWVWVALSAVAVITVVAGWPGSRWPRRNLSVFAASVCLLSAGLTVNGWLGYYPTVYVAWNQLTAGPLPDQTDWATVSARRRSAVQPTTGAVLAVTISAEASKFSHRKEFVYLPPAWFTSSPPPRLPAVMMIAGEFNTPADWARVGDAVTTLDAFAAVHDGNAPVAIFVDSTGAFGNDTECVNGPRGNAADHLTKEVVPYLVATFGVNQDRANWGIVGFSSGGTCAIDLTVMHPATFGTFVDIAGDISPNAGTKAQTIDRLFGGDPAAWSTFDPSTVISHTTYTDVTGLFVVHSAAAVTGQAAPPTPDSYDIAANTLCALGKSHGIRCAVLALGGRHVWPFAAAAFAATLPWLAGELNTPGVPPLPFGN